MTSLCLQPDWTWTDAGWREQFEVVVSDGRIRSVGPISQAGERLRGRALLPGLINAHSHAFQRTIRGRTEQRDPARPHDDFWTWREQMYRAAMRLQPDELEKVARLLYLEMVEAGITTVGEFHYLHHQPDGRPYSDPDELALRLQAAAEWAGLNLVLLRCAYHRSGFQIEQNPLQIRFLDRHWEDSLAAVERLRSRGLAVGVAPHSIRAVPAEWLAPLAEYARKHGLPLHMHVSEQTAEIEQSLAEYGCRPVQLLQRHGLLGEDFTAVHAIHLLQEEVDALQGCNVCSCPTTERNLGDGVVQADALRAAGCHFTLGTDSQCQIDLWEDARQLDYHLRLVRRQRAVLDSPAGGLSDWLLQTATQGGARSLLRPDLGSVRPGATADLVAVNLDHPVLAGDDPRHLVWAATPACVDQVWSAGVPRLCGGRHPRREEAVAGYRNVMEQLARA
jgi:formimidoylglutamate deiminase